MARDTHNRLDAVLEGIRRRWGKDTIRTLRDPHVRLDVPYISTGFPTLDALVGIGGIPRGYITEITGAPTSGVGTLALKLVAAVHAAGDAAVYIDMSRTFDADYAVRCGIDTANLLIIQPLSHADALDIAYSLIVSGGVGLVIYDCTLSRGTLSAFTSEINRLLSPLAHSYCALVFLLPEITYSIGQAVLRLRLRRERWLLRRQDVRGYRTRVKVLKNKFAPPNRQVVVSIGFSTTVKGDGT
jgi:recombination protein RecA